MSSTPSFPYRVAFQNDCRHVVHLSGGCLLRSAAWFVDHAVCFESKTSSGALEVAVRHSRRFRWLGGLLTETTVVVSPGGKAVFLCRTPSPLQFDVRTHSHDAGVTQYRFDHTKRWQEHAEYLLKLRSSALTDSSSTPWRGVLARASIEIDCTHSPNPLRRMQCGDHRFMVPPDPPPEALVVVEGGGWGDWGAYDESEGLWDL